MAVLSLFRLYNVKSNGLDRKFTVKLSKESRYKVTEYRKNECLNLKHFVQPSHFCFITVP